MNPASLFLKLSATVLFAFFLSPQSLSAQASGSTTNYHAYLGFGLIDANLNLALTGERRILSSKHLGLYGRVTGSYFFNDFQNRDGAGVTGALTLITGKRNGHLELNAGAGATWINRRQHNLPFFTAGYRYQKPSRGFIFKVELGVDGVFMFGFGHAFR